MRVVYTLCLSLAVWTPCLLADTGGSSVGGDVPTARLTRVADNPAYGHTKEKPIKVGGGVMGGPAQQRKYLNALRGPTGQRIMYSRLGSCCSFDRPTLVPLDIYEVTYEGLASPIELYLDSYETGPLLIPVGLSSKDDKRRAKKDKR